MKKKNKQIMSSFTCTCNGASTIVSSCDQCRCSEGIATCTANTNAPKIVLGISLGLFVTIFVLTLVVWALMIWFSVHVLRKCKGKPNWLNPVVITLLVVWLLLGWVPGLGFVFFVALLILLILYNVQCGPKAKRIT